MWLTLFNRAVLNARPLNQVHGHQSSDGNVPACRFAQPSVAGLLPLKVSDAECRAPLRHSDSIVTGIRN